jgi:hypothetical protein
MPEYEAKLRAAGFSTVRWRSIREQVFTPLARYARRRLQSPAARRMNPLVRALWRASVKGMEEGDLRVDYVLVTADKPS